MGLLLWQVALSGQNDNNSTDSLAQALQNAGSPQERASALQSLVQANWNNERDQAKTYLRELEELSAQLQVDSITAFVRKQQALLLYHSGDYEGARTAFNRASQWYEKAGLTTPALQCQARAGIMYSIMGDYEQAEAIYRPALQQARQAKAPEAEVFLLSQMGTLFHYQGISDSAQHYYETAIAHYQQRGDSLGMMRPMYNLAVLQMEAEQYENSVATYTVIYNYQMGKKSYEDAMITLEGLASANQQMGRLNEAADNLMEMYQLSDQLGDNQMKIHALRGMSLVEGERQQFEQSKRYLQEALALSRQLNNADQMLAAYYRMGQLYQKQEQYDSAALFLQEGLAMQDTLASQRYTVIFLLQLGQVYADAGKLEQAAQIAQRMAAFEPAAFDAQQLLSYYRLQGVISEAKGDYAGVVRYQTESFKDYLKNQLYRQAKEDALLLMAAHKALDQTDKALHYAETVHWLNDSIASRQDVELLAEQRKDFEFQLERQQIEAEQAKETAVLQARARQNSIVAIGGLLLAALGFGFFWYTRRQKQTIAGQNQQLQHLNETKDRLFAIIGHDLRKPAIAFRGIAKKVNFLLRKKDFATLEQLGEEIEKDAAGLSQLTENLLNWALTQRDVMPYQPTQLKLLPLLEDTAAPFQTALQNKQLDLEWAVPEDSVVYSDANALSTIVRNLLDNAIKFTPEGGQITIAGTAEGQLLKLKVKDTGVGIPPEKLKELFLLKKDRTQPGTAGEKGSGLGLHLAHELSKLNQSSLGVNSHIGKGTIFTLSLPLKAT